MEELRHVSSLFRRHFSGFGLGRGLHVPETPTKGYANVCTQSCADCPARWGTPYGCKGLRRSGITGINEVAGQQLFCFESKGGVQELVCRGREKVLKRRR